MKIEYRVEKSRRRTVRLTVDEVDEKEFEKLAYRILSFMIRQGLDLVEEDYDAWLLSGDATRAGIKTKGGKEIVVEIECDEGSNIADIILIRLLGFIDSMRVVNRESG